MISLVRVCAPRTFAWRIFRRLMSSQLSYDVSVRAADLAPPPDLRTPTRGNWGIRTAAQQLRRRAGDATRAMLGKDYMLAIILVNCDVSKVGSLDPQAEPSALSCAFWGYDKVLFLAHIYAFLLQSHVPVDDLWGDQSLEGEPGLPPGWRKIRDAAGTYYWHVPSGSTQWQRPTWESGDAEDAGTKTEGIWGLRPPKGRSFSSLESSLDRSNSLSWYGEESYIQRMEPGAKCFAVRSLGWVEVPEEDLVPGKSSIAVNNCIQQLAQTRSQSQPLDGAWGEGQNMLMILKKDVMSLVNPLDHSLIHRQPLVHIRVWGVGSSKGRDFAFVAGDKDSCMLKCHVFRCDVPAKAIASALHGLCAQILSERVGVSGDSPCCSLDPISPEDLPRQVPLEAWRKGSLSEYPGQLGVYISVELLDAVSQAAQKYEALYMGTLPVTKAMALAGSLSCRSFQGVQYQKCLVASAARGKAWGAQARARLRLKRTSSVDSPGGPLPLPLLKGGVGGAGAAPRKRGVFSFLDAFRLKPSLLHMP
ncbi:hypothetical protein E2I00_000267 [Balaenoptera physalus]|uniref:Amyloid beta precursor protein binding family B member 3 n=1 Tax=Balaenoptera physalus TaxID=9770 RepID=A0A643BWE0_BALPH|nr:hypothetical protein E2I00_000267 [Balaenoptera physalus]